MTESEKESFIARWNKTVNRIRRYYGMEPLFVPVKPSPISTETLTALDAIGQKTHQEV